MVTRRENNNKSYNGQLLTALDRCKKWASQKSFTGRGQDETRPADTCLEVTWKSENSLLGNAGHGFATLEKGP